MEDSAQLICFNCDHYAVFHGTCFHPKCKGKLPEDGDFDKYPTTCKFFKRNPVFRK